MSEAEIWRVYWLKWKVSKVTEGRWMLFTMYLRWNRVPAPECAEVFVNMTMIGSSERIYGFTR
jgi:hypothetical protein